MDIPCGWACVKHHILVLCHCSVCGQGWAAFLQQNSAKVGAFGEWEARQKLDGSSGLWRPLLENEGSFIHKYIVVCGEENSAVWAGSSTGAHRDFHVLNCWALLAMEVPPGAVLSVLSHLLHSVITAGLNLSRVFGGTAKTALKKCPWISVIPVQTGEQPVLLLVICH